VSPQRRSTPSDLFDKKLYAYALAAGAGLLAAPQAAQAGIIYLNPPDVTYTNANFNLDFNNDTLPDVFFTNTPWGGGSVFGRNLFAYAHGIVRTSLGKAAALPPSNLIGPGAYWGVGDRKMAWAGFSTWSAWGVSGGPWANVTNRYLGVRFLIGGNVRYGWVRMDVSVIPSTDTISATVKDWAYEDSGGPIHSGAIPEPGTLGMLALGAVGLAIWRRCRAGKNA